MILAAAIGWLVPWAAMAAENTPPASRSRDLGFDWKFFMGDLTNAQQAAFADSSWGDVDLPHDWSIEGGEEKEQSRWQSDRIFSHRHRVASSSAIGYWPGQDSR
jgi:hypothetical protein